MPDPHPPPSTLCELRLNRGYSQTDLARRVGLSRPYLSQLESGTRSPSLGLAERLARALDITVDELLVLLRGSPPASPTPRAPGDCAAA